MFTHYYSLSIIVISMHGREGLPLICGLGYFAQWERKRGSREERREKKEKHKKRGRKERKKEKKGTFSFKSLKKKTQRPPAHDEELAGKFRMPVDARAVKERSNPHYDDHD